MLAVTAMFIAVLIGVPMGFLAAYREGTLVDIGLMFLSIAGISMPHLLGLMLLFLLCAGTWMAACKRQWRLESHSASTDAWPVKRCHLRTDDPLFNDRRDEPRFCSNRLCKGSA